MFTSVTLKNYRSLTNLSFNLLSTRGTPRKIALVYGENGVGKTNLMSSLLTLQDIAHGQDMDLGSFRRFRRDESTMDDEDVGIFGSMTRATAEHLSLGFVLINFQEAISLSLMILKSSMSSLV